MEDLAGACRSQRARERLFDIQQVSDQESGSDEEWDGEEEPDVVMDYLVVALQRLVMFMFSKTKSAL